jgi:hypothetical protein
MHARCGGAVASLDTVRTIAFSILTAASFDIPWDMIENSAQVPDFFSQTKPESADIEVSVPVLA